jgi:hypothetical protein
MESEQSLFLTKLAVAERQLHAAIRMALSDDEPLAVHTVAAAAYRILRDIKQKRGKNDLVDAYAAGIFYVARDLSVGKISGVPGTMGDAPELVKLIVEVANEIKAGTIKSAADIPLTIPRHAERKHWEKFNAPANFLKHADLDADDVIALESVDNNTLLIAASKAFIDVMGRSCPEIYVYYLSQCGDDLDFIGLSNETRDKLANLPNDRRKAFCLDLLKLMKNDDRYQI